MDINQTARMIEWLDEERRRDKLTIVKLEERLTQQQETIEALLRRLNSVESDSMSVMQQVSSGKNDADLIDQVRREMQQLIESIEAKRLTAEREAERRFEIAREAALRPVREFSEKLERLERQTTELPAISIEKDRMATTLTTLQQRVEDLYKRSEEPLRRINQLEEQRRSDSRRLSELESELPELKKTLEAVRSKMTVLEELAIRNDRKVQDVQAGDRDRREQIQQFIDQQNLLNQERDTQVQGLIKRFTEHDEAMKRNAERFETWSEAYREMKRIIDDFERIGDRLDRRINEVAEMQRLSEDRFRVEWNEYRGEEQKKWRAFTTTNDQVWATHDKDYEVQLRRPDAIEGKFAPLQESLERMWNLERARAQLYRERYQALLLEYDKPGSSPSAALLRTSNGAGESEANT